MYSFDLQEKADRLETLRLLRLIAGEPRLEDLSKEEQQYVYKQRLKETPLDQVVEVVARREGKTKAEYMQKAVARYGQMKNVRIDRHEPGINIAEYERRQKRE